MVDQGVDIEKWSEQYKQSSAYKEKEKQTNSKTVLNKRKQRKPKKNVASEEDFERSIPRIKIRDLRIAKQKSKKKKSSPLKTFAEAVHKRQAKTHKHKSKVRAAKKEAIDPSLDKILDDIAVIDSVEKVENADSSFEEGQLSEVTQDELCQNSSIQDNVKQQEQLHSQNSQASEALETGSWYYSWFLVIFALFLPINERWMQIVSSNFVR